MSHVSIDLKAKVSIGTRSSVFDLMLTFGKTPCPPLYKTLALYSKGCLLFLSISDSPWRHEQPERHGQSKPVCGEHVGLGRLDERPWGCGLDEAIDEQNKHN
jgi:hypothetical protein